MNCKECGKPAPGKFHRCPECHKRHRYEACRLSVRRRMLRGKAKDSKTYTCIDCGGEFEAGHNAIRCLGCTSEKKRKYALEYYHANKARILARSKRMRNAEAEAEKTRQARREYNADWHQRERARSRSALERLRMSKAEVVSAGSLQRMTPEKFIRTLSRPGFRMAATK